MTASTQWIATQNPVAGEYGSPDRAMGPDRLAGIVGAGRRKAALCSHERAQCELVKSYKAQQDARKSRHYPVQQFLGPDRDHV
jgi:hypothetical protein